MTAGTAYTSGPQRSIDEIAVPDLHEKVTKYKYL